MGIIYFDAHKDAHALPVKGCIAMTDSDTWSHYAHTECGEEWDIIDGEFVPLKTVEEMKLEGEKRCKRNERDWAFTRMAWRFDRYADQVALGLKPDDDLDKLRKYRNYLRDFTKLENWWNLEVPDYEEFLKENP
jgi:hypothetical protein